MDDKDISLKINKQILACGRCMKINSCYEMDYLHDAFIKVMEKIDGSYEEKGKLDSWVNTVAANSIKTNIKRERMRSGRFCSFVDARDFPRCKTGCCDIKRKIVIELLMSAIESLPADDYKMVVERMNGKSRSAIAVDLNLNIKTVRKHLAKSYNLVRGIVAERYYEMYNENIDDIDF